MSTVIGDMSHIFWPMTNVIRQFLSYDRGLAGTHSRLGLCSQHIQLNRTLILDIVHTLDSCLYLIQRDQRKNAAGSVVLVVLDINSGPGG